MIDKYDVMYHVITVQEFFKNPIIYLNYDGITWIHKKGKNKYGYINMYCGFDIETYTTEEHYGYMYLWQFSLYAIENYIVYGRTWNEFQKFISILIEYLHLSHEKRLIVGVANLSFEHQFMKQWFEWGRVFAREVRKPILASLEDETIEFRDVLMITGGSLKQLAKDYTITQKASGEQLGYNIPRNYKSELTSENLDYAIRDVAIVSEFMYYLFETYIRPSRYIPMTKTGILRRKVKDAMNNDYTLKQEIYRAYPDNQILYEILMQYVFRGGYVHGNVRHTGHKLHGFKSRDITSSYPYSMLTYDKFPNSPLLQEPVELFEQRILTHCVIFSATFLNIRCITDHAIESKSKCVDLTGAIVDNGRIRQAVTMTVWLTELDYFMYLKFYKWDELKVNHMYTSIPGRLPKYVRLPLAEAYEKKADMKHQGKANTPEYALYKSLVNSAFGMMVTRLQYKEVKLSSLFKEWYTDGSNFNYEKERKKAFLLPQWGIYVCAYSRFRLLNAVYECGSDTIYCDTDSIKYFGNHEEYFDIRNKMSKKNIEKVCKELSLEFSKFYDLGEFEPEYNGDCIDGKFLGAKRYIISHKGKDYPTIAGLPKDSLTKYCEKKGLDIYDIFHDGLILNTEVSLKNAVKYNDREHTSKIDGIWCFEMSSVGIYPNTFKMSLSDYYIYLMNNYISEVEPYEKRIY